MTGGRLAAVRRYVDDDDWSCCTYGDGVADIDIAKLRRVPPAVTARSRPSPPCARPAAFGELSDRAIAIGHAVRREAADRPAA